MSKPWYWTARKSINKLRFRLDATLYKGKMGLSGTRSNIRILRSILSLATGTLVLVAVTLGLLGLLEYELTDRLDLYDPIPVSDKDYYLEQIRVYAQILSAIFSIYFATIGIVVSSGYQRLRKDIIALLTTEQVGNFYSRVLVFSASFCVAASALPLFGYGPGYLVYTTSTFMVLATLLTLFPLGQRLFNFFDLSPLIQGEIIPALSRHIQAVTVNGLSVSLANHHHLQAQRLLEQMNHIDDHLKGEASTLTANLPAMTNSYTRLLVHYLNKKHEINRDSYWFPRRRKHRRWLHAGDTITEMALRTSSQLIPEEKPDHDWLESEIFIRLQSHVELAIARKEYGLALRLLATLESRIAVYARNLSFDIGMKEISGMRSAMEGALAAQAEVTDDLEQKTLIALFDTWAALGGNLCLETFRRMLTFEKELSTFFKKDEWTDEALHSLPVFLKEQTSFLSRRLKFELDVEGHRLSQPKYLRQLMVQRLLRNYVRIIPIAMDFHQNQVTDFAERLISAKRPEAATQILLASLHAYWKIPSWLFQISDLLERYRGYEHYKEEPYLFPTIDLEQLSASFSSARDRAIGLLADPTVVAYLSSFQDDEDLPDQLGHIYFVLAEECIDALRQNRSDLLANVVPVFFLLAYLHSDVRLPKEDPAISPEFRLHLVSTIICDMTSVAGFAILYGEHHQNPDLSRIVLDALFAIVRRFPDQRQYLVRMLRLANTRSFSRAVSPRDRMRSQWKMDFEGEMRDAGYGDAMNYRRTKRHPSVTVEKFMQLSFANASDLFFALKVLPEIGEVDFSIDHTIKELKRNLDRNPASDEVEDEDL
ncbi:hypothetical protein HFO06_00155 [Rhizobium leguminosarum]|uniref:hypothetical protein n=1 Tax=Rhizobium leguminosarum TaxID=384 RepID=UPI001C9579CE|nr:hypothetical protein [Rhizobium leguminosarum]MBY5761529.1 hypothetical protein [Rhizobium leguminosarum]